MSEDDISMDNPAGRLHGLLTLMRQTKANNVLGGFAAVFDIDAGDYGQIYRCLGKAAAEADEVGASLLRSDNEAFQKVYLKTVRRIKNAFAVSNFDVQWEQFKQSHVFEDDLRALEFCSAALSKTRPEPVLSGDELKELLRRVDELYREVWDAPLDQELKAVILAELQDIRTAIHDYKIQGSIGLDDAVKSAVVTAVATQHVDANDKGVMDKFRTFVSDVTALIQLGKLLHPLIDLAGKYLPGPK